MQDKKSFTVAEIKAKMEYYCAYQDRCHYEVEKKLGEFFLIPEAKDEIILSLMQENFLNEERYAKSFARGKFYYKNWGRIKIKSELKKRNISEYLINKGLEEIDENDYLTTIEKLIRGKIRTVNESSEYKLKMKISRYLYSKGFEYEHTSRILEGLITE